MARIDEVTITIGTDVVEIIHKGCVAKAEHSGKVTNAVLGSLADKWWAEWQSMPSVR